MFYTPELLQDPNTIIISLDGNPRECFLVDISGYEYDLCEEASHKRGCSAKPRDFGRGLANTADDPKRGERSGLLGEMAYGKMLSEPVDLNYRRKGDEQDSILDNKYRIDVKCATYNYYKGLVVYSNDVGRRYKVDKDIYVFGFVRNEDRKSRQAQVVLVGAALLKEVLASPILPGFKGGLHKNYVVPYSKLRQITRFMAFAKSLKGY